MMTDEPLYPGELPPRFNDNDWKAHSEVYHDHEQDLSLSGNTLCEDEFNKAASAPLGIHERSQPVLARPIFTVTGVRSNEEFETLEHLQNNQHKRPRSPSSSMKASSASEVSAGEQSQPLPPIFIKDPIDAVAIKRARNTLAARKSRQKKMERFDELETEITRLREERDHWKPLALNRCERSQAAVAVESMFNLMKSPPVGSEKLPGFIRLWNHLETPHMVTIDVITGTVVETATCERQSCRSKRQPLKGASPREPVLNAYLAGRLVRTELQHYQEVELKFHDCQAPHTGWYEISPELLLVAL